MPDGSIFGGRKLLKRQDIKFLFIKFFTVMTFTYMYIASAFTRTINNHHTRF